MHEDVRAFYDRFGRKQDWQRFYEDPALRDLIRHASFEDAHAVVEFGCGTGRLAEQLLRDHLSDAAKYIAVDASSTMVSLARDRLAPFGDRVRVLLTDGSLRVAEASESCDRFISTHVIDSLSADDIRALLGEAHRLLAGSGRLGMVSLTHGETGLARLVERIWVQVHRVRPSWVGWCRPVSLCEFVAPEWQVIHRAVVTSFAISSEVVVAKPMLEAAA